MPTHWCNDLSELLDFSAYVVAYAPDGFPPEDEMTLAHAFSEYRHGLEISAKEIQVPFAVNLCRSMLDEAHNHYTNGRTKEGAWKLQEIERVLRRNLR